MKRLKFLPLKIQQLENVSLKVYFGFFSSDKLCHWINTIVIYFSELTYSTYSNKPNLDLAPTSNKRPS